MVFLAALKKDQFRKPNTKMFEYLKDEILKDYQIDLEKSFYCGDQVEENNIKANSDILFAKKLNLKFFTPEEFLSQNDFK